MSRLSNILRDATATKETLNEEFKGVKPKTSLPIVGQKQEMLVQRPTAKDVETYSTVHRNVCGHCKYFDLETGRKEMIRQGFLERMAFDEKWKLSHLGAQLDELGLCGASGGGTVTSFIAKACDHYSLRGRF